MIVCCLTTFNPEIGRLTACLASLVKQVEKLVVIDNNSLNKTHIEECCRAFNVELILLSNNFGIAKAQNVVWSRAIDDGAEFIVFSDQDTVFPQNSIEKLIDVLHIHPNSAAVAPVFSDKNATRSIEVSVNIFEKPLKVILGPTESRVVSHVISSGMIVRNAIASKIGFNREDLFIDWVDTEWCWRARLKGYEIVQTGTVILEHVLGEDRIVIGKKQLTRHKLFRTYYKIRNGIILIRDIKNQTIRNHLMLHTLKNIILTFFSIGSLSDKVKIILRSIKDGIAQRGGQYE